MIQKLIKIITLSQYDQPELISGLVSKSRNINFKNNYPGLLMKRKELVSQKIVTHLIEDFPRRKNSLRHRAEQFSSRSQSECHSGLLSQTLLYWKINQRWHEGLKTFIS